MITKSLLDPTVHRPVLGLAVALVATTLIAGCGSSGSSEPAAAGSPGSGATSATTSTPAPESTSAPAPTTSSATPAVDLCTLLTAAQVTAINHVAYDTTSTVTNGDFHGCEYHNAGKSRADITSLDITLTSNPGCWAAAASADGPGTAIPEVGDTAFGYSLGMHVKHGDSCLTIEGQTVAESNHDWGADTVMARTLLPKLF